MTTEAILMAGGMAVGVVVWLVRLEGRQNLSDANYTALDDKVEEIRLDVKELLKK